MIEVEVKSITREARDIHSYELRACRASEELPPFSAGAHIDLHLPNKLVRSYSLSNSQAERERYVVTVAKDAAGRGGSRFMHECLRVGDILPISAPRNNFPLNEDAEHSLFIAGGIGITPLWSMAQRLRDLGRPWQLIYCARTRGQAAFVEPLLELKRKAGINLRLNFDGEPGGQKLDIAEAIMQVASGTHIYCCGPLPMLVAFEEANAARLSEQIHVEYFTPKEALARTGGFTLVLQRSGKEVFVEKGKTILDTILSMGIDKSYSCMEGTCGECETRVVCGVPDHRDVCLTKAEQASNEKMMICCSGSKSEKLVLDL
jgi:tetrachlorobenzoquinone reductase